jgi:hypothetical protein
MANKVPNVFPTTKNKNKTKNTMKLSTFNSIFDPRSRETFQVRPAWIVRLAELGRLGGDDHIMIGVATDLQPETIAFGVASKSELAEIEGTLSKSIERVMEDRIMVQARIRGQSRRLVAISPLLSEAIAVCSVEVWPTSPPERHRAVQDQALGRERFAKQRAAALAGIQPKWIAGDMRHRKDFPAWFPAWVCDLVAENSRQWLELPNAPEGFKSAPDRPPQIPICLQPTNHPAMPHCLR